MDANLKRIDKMNNQLEIQKKNTKKCKKVNEQLSINQVDSVTKSISFWINCEKVGIEEPVLTKKNCIYFHFFFLNKKSFNVLGYKS